MTRLEAKALFEMIAKFSGGNPSYFALNIADDLHYMDSDADCRALADMPHIARNPRCPIVSPYTERMLATMRAILRNIDGIPWGIRPDSRQAVRRLK
jgi:hypothetical protein